MSSRVASVLTLVTRSVAWRSISASVLYFCTIKTRIKVQILTQKKDLLLLLLLPAATIAIAEVRGHIARRPGCAFLAVVARGNASFWRRLAQQLHPLHLVLLLRNFATAEIEGTGCKGSDKERNGSRHSLSQHVGSQL